MVQILVHVLVLIFVSGLVVEGAQGQAKKPLQHLKKDNPNEIHVNYSHEPDCKTSHEQVVDNELAQSRIKRKPLWNFYELVLFVDVRCSETVPGREFLFMVTANFGRFEPAEIVADRSFIIVYLEPGNFGSYGISTQGSKGNRTVRDALRNAVEDALTDYLTVNFDL